MYRSKGQGDQKLWMKVDLKEIRFYPSGDTIRRYQCNQIELLFRFTPHGELAISIVESKEIYEIRIPIGQSVIGFRNIQNKYIEFDLKKNFFRTYLIHSKSPGSNVLRSQKDPTNGGLKDATKITFIPCEKVHPMTIFMLEIGIRKFTPSLNARSNKDDKYETQFNEVNEDLIIEDDPLPKNVPEYYITCHFLTFTRMIRLSTDNSFMDLLKEINKSLECEINSFKYKNNDGEIITVENEESWGIARMNFSKHKILSFDIYMQQYDDI